MTRFARKTNARGSTKREPEEATPWSQMVSQIRNTSGGVEDDDEYMDVVEEEENKPEVSGSEEDSENEEVGKAVSMKVSEEDEDESEDDFEVKLEEEPEMESGKNSLKRKPELVSAEEPAKKKKKKRPEKCKICGSKEHRKMDCGELPEERRKELQDLFKMKVERKGKGTGRKKNKRKDKLPYEETDPKPDSENKTNEDSVSEEKSTKKKKKNKPRKPRELIRDRSGAVVEEGEAIFQGFRVRKEDEKKLKTLYKELKEKGLSKKELDEALKRERRIAEKSLARSKKLVCFKCRQPGHMLADCPLAVDTDKHPGSGLCYKCGSLEHTSKDCKSKLKKENAYNFAVCFICKQEGHLAKACPDNPKGLYPKGGGCVFCGSVEHLKRDCMRKVAKDLKSGVKVETMGDNLEDEPSRDFKPVKNKKRIKSEKIVAF